MQIIVNFCSGARTLPLQETGGASQCYDVRVVKKYTDEEYAALLPKKQVGTAVLFFNSKNELLVVKPDYREEWLVPGGAADEDESPLHCALRETREEIGLSAITLQLVGIYFAHKKGVYPDSLKFVFYGGTLTDDQIASIKLDTGELEEYIFMPLENALPLLSPSLQKCVPKSVEAIETRAVVYIE